MGSDSDWETMRPAAEVLEELGVSFEARVVSAHRTPGAMVEYAKTAVDRGLSLIIAGAGGAAHLPGMTASLTLLPVVGVPVEAKGTRLNGLDALLSILQMPAEVGVATMRVGQEGAEYAARFAAAALACRDRRLRAVLRSSRNPTRGGLEMPEAPTEVVILAEDGEGIAVIQHAEQCLSELGVPHSKKVVGRAAGGEDLARLVETLEAEGAAVFLAGSGAMDRPGGGIGFACAVAQTTTLPVLGVPILTEPVRCVDHFLQPFLRMPPGVATFAVGRPGAINAALFAATILSGPGTEVWENLDRKRREQEKKVRDMKIEGVSCFRGGAPWAKGK
jgi:5-(carboxyamino)imidazole ribonucleotide mutase